MKCTAVRKERSIELVLNKGDEFVGRIFIMSPIHIEGAEVAQKHKGTMALKKLVDEAETEVMSLGFQEVLAFGANAEMNDYIERLGYKKLPWTVWKKEFPCR